MRRPASSSTRVLRVCLRHKSRERAGMLRVLVESCGLCMGGALRASTIVRTPQAASMVYACD
eukprot:scaffold3142_cov416-Prasinococcus_capsulatus_cf.AAC.9